MKFKIVILILALSLNGIAQKGKGKSTSKSKTAVSTTQGIFAELHTNKGIIVLELEYKKTPFTVANFITLAQGTNPEVKVEAKKGKPFYDGLKFHRVINDFMIQGGCPLGNGSADPGYKFIDEITDLKHSGPGILSMANSGPNTNGSQFFITHKETAWLNGKHTVFGKVTKGQDIVNKIVQDDQIILVKIKALGADAKKFDAVKEFTKGFASQKDVLANQELERQKQEMKMKEEKMKMMEEKLKRDAEYYEKNITIIEANKLEVENLKATGTRLPSGVILKLLKEGNGVVPAKDSDIFIHYAGYLENGVLFDSSYEDIATKNGKFEQPRKDQNGYSPFPFKFGNKTGLIPGFIEGLEQMKLNEKMMVYIPANLGYGPRGAGDVIPPDSNLIFVIEMLDKK
jgi:peptidyl-prolyl cis-trans isomerase A (cyclophilin A)